MKASDEQRVDNCKVPIELHGAKSRPDECGDGASTTMFVNCGPSTAQPVAVFNFELIDTRLEGAVRGARADEQERLARMSDQLRESLRDSCRPGGAESTTYSVSGLCGCSMAMSRWEREPALLTSAVGQPPRIAGYAQAGPTRQRRAVATFRLVI